MYKKCTSCYEYKLKEEFASKRNICLCCKKLHDKKYREENKDKILRSAKTYYQKNKEEISEKSKEHYKKNKKAIIDKIIKYYKCNKTKVKEYHKIYNIKNKTQIYNKYLINKKTYIHKYLFWEAKKRAKNNNIDFSITQEDILNIIPNNNLCPLLNIKMEVNKGNQNYNSFTLDKINPIKGYINGNVQIISYKANRSKSNATIEEYEMIVNNLRNIILNDNCINTINPRFIKPVEKSIVDFENIIDHAWFRAKEKQLSFNLNIKYLKSIFPLNHKCPLLNIELKRGIKKAIYCSPTLDRIFPQKGYIEGNVIFISFKANTIKNNLTLDEMTLLLNNWKKLIK